MPTHLSRYFRLRREANCVGFGELARRCGYINISKGANRIQHFEARGKIALLLLGKLAVILGITSAEIQHCIEQDRAEWQRQANQPIEPHLVVRLMPGVYSHMSIPGEVRQDRQSLESFAAAIAAAKRKSVVLVLSKTARVWFNEDGAVTRVTEDTFENEYGPRLSIGGQRFLFELLDEGRLLVRPKEGS